MRSLVGTLVLLASWPVSATAAIAVSTFAAPTDLSIFGPEVARSVAGALERAGIEVKGTVSAAGTSVSGRIEALDEDRVRLVASVAGKSVQVQGELEQIDVLAGDLGTKLVPLALAAGATKRAPAVAHAAGTSGHATVGEATPAVAASTVSGGNATPAPSVSVTSATSSPASASPNPSLAPSLSPSLAPSLVPSAMAAPAPSAPPANAPQPANAPAPVAAAAPSPASSTATPASVWSRVSPAPSSGVATAPYPQPYPPAYPPTYAPAYSGTYASPYPPSYASPSANSAPPTANYPYPAPAVYASGTSTRRWHKQGFSRAPAARTVLHTVRLAEGCAAGEWATIAARESLERRLFVQTLRGGCGLVPLDQAVAEAARLGVSSVVMASLDGVRFDARQYGVRPTGRLRVVAIRDGAAVLDRTVDVVGSAIGVADPGRAGYDLTADGFARLAGELQAALGERAR